MAASHLTFPFSVLAPPAFRPSKDFSDGTFSSVAVLRTRHGALTLIKTPPTAVSPLMVMLQLWEMKSGDEVPSHYEGEMLQLRLEVRAPQQPVP